MNILLRVTSEENSSQASMAQQVYDLKKKIKQKQLKTNINKNKNNHTQQVKLHITNNSPCCLYCFALPTLWIHL